MTLNLVDHYQPADSYMSQDQLGLYRLMSYPQREYVERELEVSFADIYNALDCAWDEMRELEKLLNRIFNGDDRGRID